ELGLQVLVVALQAVLDDLGDDLGGAGREDRAAVARVEPCVVGDRAVSGDDVPALAVTGEALPVRVEPLGCGPVLAVPSPAALGQLLLLERGQLVGRFDGGPVDEAQAHARASCSARTARNSARSEARYAIPAS